MSRPPSRWRTRSTVVHYGGICCVDGCDRPQTPGRIYCPMHVRQAQRGWALHMPAHFDLINPQTSSSS